MEPNITELEAATVAAKTAADAAGGTDEALNKVLKDAETALATAKSSSDPVAKALADEKQRTQRTEADKAAHALRKNAQRAKELGLDVSDILGVSAAPAAAITDDDSKPATLGDLRRLEQERAAKTALDMADEIEDENERNLTKEYLGRIKPSGNPAEDLKFARHAVNSVKSGKILEEVARRGVPSNHSSGSGGPAPAGGDDGTFVPTAQEAGLMKPPFNLSKEAVIAARKASQK